MGARGRGSGVEPRAKTIRLRFLWSGKRRYETLAIAPTAPNIRAAQRLMDQINDEITRGVFHYARHFPDSPHAKDPTTLTTFKEFADRWLETLTTELGTEKNYRSSLTKVWMPDLGDKRLRDIRHSDIKVIIARRAKVVSGKTINNDLIPLRAVFEAALEDGKIEADPLQRISNLRHQSPTPDPFTPDEVGAILDHMLKAAPPQVWAYYTVAFLTGLRPSEQIAATWGKVDWNNATLRIDNAVVRGVLKGTKTNTVRDVDLSPDAVAALRVMKAYTFLKDTDHPIFCHPATGRPWTNDQYQRVTYFHPALKKLGVRKRDAYQTRHTYATTALMAGVTPAYIARQMGHANAAMLFKHYGKWIDRADKGRERAKLEAALAQRWPSATNGL